MYRREVAQLRRRMAKAEAEVKFCRRRQKWLESSLATQRHARQVLEAAVSANYTNAAIRMREVVRKRVPRGAIVLVVSRGDEKLLELAGRQGWHFPRGQDGQYAGYYPADSEAAIAHLETLAADGAQFLLFPATSFWWFEHYRGLEEYLARDHGRVWRDDLCALYRLSPPAAMPSAKEVSCRSAERRPCGRGIERARGAAYDIVCFPIINWDSRFQRPQQLMSQFAASGHRVFYLSHEFTKAGGPYRVRRLAARLYEVNLQGAGYKIREGLLDGESREALLRSLSALRRDHVTGPAAAIVQQPFWWPLAKAAKAAFGWPVVYDCMDLHAGFVTSHPLLVEQEVELLARADLVVVSSATLEAAACRRNRNVLLVRNGCDYDHFACPAKKRHARRPVIGYYGAIAEWFDSDLVADLAQRRRDWDFILIGSTASADVRRLSKLPNVALPGEKPYAHIPGWLARFDVAILPFKRTPLTEAVNPVKAYEIFAAGKPLVSVPLPEMRRLVPLVRLASTAKQFEREIEKELGSHDRRPGRRRRLFAKKNTWRARFEELRPALRGLFRGITQAGGDSNP